MPSKAVSFSKRTPRAAVSWSGGKDSCLALVRAAERGLPADTLLTMSDPGGLSKSHMLSGDLIAAQARALGMKSRVVQAELSSYGATFQDALGALRDAGHTHMVFGDIDLRAHRDWLEPACRKAELEPVFPLWQMSRHAVADEVIARGIRAIVVCVDGRWLGSSYCGMPYDDDFLSSLPDGVCPCGEGGEFHTFVWDAPVFCSPLRVALGSQHRVDSAPPLAPTELTFQSLRLEQGPR